MSGGVKAGDSGVMSPASGFPRGPTFLLRVHRDSARRRSPPGVLPALSRRIPRSRDDNAPASDSKKMQGGMQRTSLRGGPAGAVSILAEHDKLITPEAGNGIRTPGGSQEPKADRLDHVIANRMAQDIVDRFEVIDVKENDGDVGVPGRGAEDSWSAVDKSARFPPVMSRGNRAGVTSSPAASSQ